MTVQFLLDKMSELKDQSAVAVNDNKISFQQLSDKFFVWQAWLVDNNIQVGKVVTVKGDYSDDVIALFLALADNRNIVVPLSLDSKSQYAEFCSIAEHEYDIEFIDDQAKLTVTGIDSTHTLYAQLRQHNAPGLVLFSSGSTGKSKAIVHNLSLLINKFKTPRQTLRTLVFLQFDHIGGINTLLYILANGGMAVVPKSRKPEDVCATIAAHKVQVLPTSPTFLNLMLLSGACEEYDISSLELITYGTETMPESTLAAISKKFPETRLLQTYGLSEIGILRSKSKDSKSLWVKVGGKEFATKVVDNRLWIKSESAMLGYLNAPSPFDTEGYLDTGDVVEQQGEWLKILGRQTELINVGGEKVYPAEIESVILAMNEVDDVAVYAMPHLITGMVVAAEIKLISPEPLSEFKVKLRQHCISRLPAFKIPKKITLIENYTHNARFKRMRKKPNKTMI
jgi:acyl-CoA synthetase (AMP-forming)/AMP-acid ligase II